MKKIFIDSDIILDLLARRGEFYPHAARLFTNIEKHKIEAYTSPVVVSNIFYILRKIKGKAFAIDNLKKLRLLVKLLEVDEKIVDLALASPLRDFEDAIQLYAAKEKRIKYLLTRNIKDYPDNEVMAVTAEEYNALLKKAEDSQ